MKFSVVMLLNGARCFAAALALLVAWGEWDLEAQSNSVGQVEAGGRPAMPHKR
jgi:hypothetical protein